MAVTTRPTTKFNYQHFVRDYVQIEVSKVCMFTNDVLVQLTLATAGVKTALMSEQVFDMHTSLYPGMVSLGH